MLGVAGKKVVEQEEFMDEGAVTYGPDDDDRWECALNMNIILIVNSKTFADFICNIIYSALEILLLWSVI